MASPEADPRYTWRESYRYCVGAAGAAGGRAAGGTVGDGEVRGDVPAAGLEVADGPPAPGATKQLIEPMVFGPYCT
jgi:hypothetical protein